MKLKEAFDKQGKIDVYVIRRENGKLAKSTSADAPLWWTNPGQAAKALRSSEGGRGKVEPATAVKSDAGYNGYLVKETEVASSDDSVITEGITYEAKNTVWGFYGTVSNRAGDAIAKKLFDAAAKWIKSMTGTRDRVDVINYLDSQYGRHLADAWLQFGDDPKKDSAWMAGLARMKDDKFWIRSIKKAMPGVIKNREMFDS